MVVDCDILILISVELLILSLFFAEIGLPHLLSSKINPNNCYCNYVI